MKRCLVPLVLLAIGCAAGNDPAPEPLAPPEIPAVQVPITSEIAIHRSEQPARLLLLGPGYLFDTPAHFTVELPIAQAEKIDSIQLIVTDHTDRPETRALSSYTPTARVDIPLPDDQTPTANRKGGKVYRIPVQVDATSWADGEYVAGLLVKGGPGRLGIESRLARKTEFFVVRRRFRQSFDDPDRAELAVWLRHVNRHVGAWGKVPYWRNIEKVIENPELLWDQLRGLVLRSYHNPQLDRLQPYGMYVPKAYDPDRPMPLLVLLHGSGGNYLNLVSDVFHGQELESHPMLVANAGAFGRQEYRHMALNDVLWVIEDVRKKYNVDADRIYLQGISLGGRGSLEIPALAPGIFAAASPQGVYGIFTELTDPATTASLDRYSLMQGARWDIRTLLPNLRHTPMQFIYGMEDPTTPPHNATTLKFLLRETFGGTAEMRGFDADHNITYPVYKWSDTRKWMLKHRRKQDPDKLLFRTNALRHNRHYWLEVHELASYWQIPSVLAMLPDSQGALILLTDNVAALSARPPKPVDRILIDHQQIELEAPSGEIHFRKAEDGKWAVVSAEQVLPGAGRKRHGVSGPIWDVASGKMVFVYGTAGSKKETANLKQIATDTARLDVHWGDKHLPVVADVDVTDRQKGDCNLILIGDARTNQLIAGKDWPFDLETVGAGKGIVLPAEARAEDQADALAFVWPSPFGKGRYAMVLALADPADPLERTLRPTDTWSPYVWSDWVALKQVEIRRGDRVFHRLTNVADGVFTPDWKMQRHDGLTRRMRYMNWQRPAEKTKKH